MSWTVTVDKEVLRRLKRIPEPDRGRLVAAIAALKNGPETGDVRPLTGRSEYRLRVGKWRVLMEVDTGHLEIFVAALGSRGDVYK